MAAITHEELSRLAEDPDALWEQIEAWIEDGDSRLPAVARFVIAELGDVELVLTLMDDFIVNCERETVDAIRAGLVEHPSVGAALVERVAGMLAHEAAEERRAGALFTGLLALEDLAPTLVTALDDRYFLTRMEAATALGLLRWRPAIAKLRAALDDEDILVRNAAIESLTQIPDPELLRAYTGGETESGEEQVGAFDDALARSRRHALRILDQYRPPCARAAFQAYLDAWADIPAKHVSDEDREVIELARELLAKLED